ncbi:MAG: TIGR03619 family F420-dependent LLM class oxidoreductase [Myxococcales bacterium]|nr:TIGR03619 family F420-dependent LLM class oxidoreductase [Myxococcales bacterium]
MRFYYADAMINPEYWLPLGKALEEAGFHGITVPDSLCYPEVSDSKYPYTPDGNREFLEDKPFLDPFTQIAAMGAVTEHLKFCTFVVKLPIRHPVIVAKQASSVAVLTQNRLEFGVGVSPWPDDYRICGVPWEGRGKRMDECIQILRGLWSGEFYRHEGEIFDIESIKMCPAPSKPIPILIGGHSKAALRRAAALGDGWLHAGGDTRELRDMIAQINDLRAQYGRENEPFDFKVISPEAFHADGVHQLAEAGVTDIIIGFRNSYAMKQDSESLQHKVDMIGSYAERIISQF